MRLRKSESPNKLYGKPLVSFSNIGRKPNKSPIKVKTDDVIRSGGALKVSDDLEYNERLYCRFKNEYNLQTISKPIKQYQLPSSMKSFNGILESM